jgi:malate dehydrogenase (oxaloacetate-decarboxylating)
MTAVSPWPARLEVCRAVAEDPQKALELTGQGRTVALVSNGSDLPGLGALGPRAALPYLEDQAYLFQKMTSLAALPLACDSNSPEEIAAFAAILAPSAGVLCLDGLADEIYQSVERLLAPKDLPVFFHPQQSRPILILAALARALAITGREISEARIVVAGFEADSLALVDYLLAAGAANLVICDRSGAIHKGRPGPTSWLKEQLAQKTNPQEIKGGLNRALSGADVYVSRANPVGLTKEIASLMAHRPIILNFSSALLSPGPLAAANEPLGLGFGPGPATRLPTNLLTPLVLTGLFAGALKARAKSFSLATRLAAARALEELVDEQIDEPNRLLPLYSRPDLVEKVAAKVAEAALG